MYGRHQRELPLADYALVGDGVTAALVAKDGAIDWLCYPRFDAPAVFCRLLDQRRGGYLQVAPATAFEATRRYVGATNVLATEMETAGGKLRLTDFMPLEEVGTSPMILRKLEGLSGVVQVAVDFVPTFDFARERAELIEAPRGCEARSADATLRLSSPGPVLVGDTGATGSFTLRAGETRWLALTGGAEAPSDEEAERALRSTLERWERWAARAHVSGPYAEAMRRSALVVKLLIHRPTGGMVAAPTTSLPESPAGVRNWDYRFTWLRDSSWLASALMDLGYHDESMAFIGWLEGLGLGDGEPSIFYDLDGRVPGREQELGHLPGYAGARPVRTGNAASEQDQHDVFGEVVAAIHRCSEDMPSMRPLRPGLWKLVRALADGAAEHWRHADHGLWEQREPRQQYLASKLLCWVALDRALAMAARDDLGGPLRRWEAERALLRTEILEHGFDEDAGAFTRVLGEPDLDASALLLPRYGFLPATDHRMVATVERIRERLEVEDGLVRRYVASDGLPGTEGAFVACGFWLVDCLARQGRLDEAHRRFERLLSMTSDVGLLSEELWPATGELLGNYPQAFSHLALIRAAVSLAEAEGLRAPAGARVEARGEQGDQR